MSNKKKLFMAFFLMILLSSNTAAISWDSSEDVRNKIYYSTSPISIIEANTAKTEPFISSQSVSTDDTMDSSPSVTIRSLDSSTTYYIKSDIALCFYGMRL